MPETYHCQHCDQNFVQPLDQLTVRCPSCLRSTGLTAVQEQTKSPISTRVYLGVACIALALGGVLWFVQNKSSKSDDANVKSSQSTPGTTVVAGDKSSKAKDDLKEDLSQVEPTLVIPSFPEIKKLARSLAPDGQVLTAIKGLNSRIVRVDADQPIGREALDPQSITKTLLSTTSELPLTGVEAGAVLVHLSSELGVKPQPVLVFDAHDGRTNLRRRTIGVRVGNSLDVLTPFPMESIPAKQVSKIDYASIKSMLLGINAIHLAETHQLEAASQQLSDGLALKSNDAALRFLRGQLASLRGEVDAGLESMATAVQSDEDASGRFQLGVAYLRSEQTFKAYEAFRRAVVLNPNHTEAWRALGQLAIERLASAPEVQRENIGKELDDIEKALGNISKSSGAIDELKVQRLLASNQPNEALEVASEALNKNPKNASLHILMAEMARAAGHNETAIKHLESAAKSEPKDAEALMMLSRLYSEMGDTDKALSTLERSVSVAPHDPQLLVQLATAYDSTGKSQEAKRVATKLQKRFPGVLEGPMILAQVALAEGKTKDAIQLLTDAIGKNPRASSLFVMLYFVYATSSQSEKAAETLKRFVRIDPDGRMKIAQQLLQTGQIESAATLLSEEFEAKPHRLEVAITLGQLLRVAGKNDEVTRIKRKALEHASDKVEFEKLFDQAMEEIDKQAAAAANQEKQPSKPPAPADRKPSK